MQRHSEVDGIFILQNGLVIILELEELVISIMQYILTVGNISKIYIQPILVTCLVQHQFRLRDGIK